MSLHPSARIVVEREALIAVAALAYDHARSCMQMLAPLNESQQLTAHDAQVHAQSMWLRWSGGQTFEEDSRESVCRAMFEHFVAGLWSDRQQPRTRFAKSAFSVASGSRGESFHLACLAVARSSAWLSQCYNESSSSVRLPSVVAADQDSGRSVEQSLSREVLNFALPQLRAGRPMMGVAFKLPPPVCVATRELSRDQVEFASSHVHDAVYGVARAAFESAMLTLVSMYSSGSPVRVSPMLIDAALHLAASAFEYMRPRLVSTEVPHLRQLFVLIFVNSSLTRLTLRPGDAWQQSDELDKVVRLVFYCLCLAKRQQGLVEPHLELVASALVVTSVCHTLALSPKSKPARCHRDAMLANSPTSSNWFEPLHVHASCLSRWYERTSDSALDAQLMARPRCVVQPPPSAPEGWRWLPVRMQPDGASDLMCGVCHELLRPEGRSGVHSLQSSDLQIPHDRSCGLITCGSCAHHIRGSAGLQGAKCPYCRKLMSGAFKPDPTRSCIVTASFTPLPFALQKRVKLLVVECARCKGRELAGDLAQHRCGEPGQQLVKKEHIELDA